MNINPNHDGNSRKEEKMNPITKTTAVAVLVALGLVLAAQSAEPPSSTDTLLQTRVSAPSDCQGWSIHTKWDRFPSVLANRSLQAVTLLDGAVTVPPSSVVVNPGAEEDVCVVWRSPFSGKVSLRGRFADACPSHGGGVSWAISLDGKSGRKTLARGVIDRGGAQAIPAPAYAGQLGAVVVEKDDFLRFTVAPRQNPRANFTVVDIVVTESGGQGRVWDLAKDIAAHIQKGNPHADSLGNAAVWYLVAPKGNRHIEPSLTAAPPKAGQQVQSWTVATDDTKLTVGATKEGQLVISALSNPATDWNWTREPAVFPLVDKATVNGKPMDLAWKFKDAAVDEAEGRKVTVRFICEQPALELKSQWSARSGPGPVRHAMTIVNRSAEAVILPLQASVHIVLSGPAEAASLLMWSFHCDGERPDPIGVYQHAVKPGFAHTIETQPGNGKFIPYAVFDAHGKQGVYIGIEWSYCRISAAMSEPDTPATLRVRGGEFPTFAVKLAPGETFDVPPCFIGAYKGDVDDAGNRLRRYLFAYSMPEIVRKDANYPKVQWNAFGATGAKPGSWNCVEAKYYPLIDDIAPLGFEEVMIDVGWWPPRATSHEPVNDPVDWPSGMAKAAAHAHQAGMRFGLYWNRGEAMASAEGRQRRMAHIKRLYDEHKADLWRSDSTGGPVVGGSYAEVKGFYDMLDQLYREMPNFQWENCAGGGHIKDFGAMRRAVKIFLTDTYGDVCVRQTFYDSSYCFPPAQLMGCLGSKQNRRLMRPSGLRFAFRSMSLGAPEWFLDAPNGGNGGAPWTDDEKAAVKAAVDTYKTRIRPLVRSADLYHILPRPDGRNWDGIQYFDPATKRGVVYLFKPGAVADTITLKLRGVEPSRRYRVSFEDGSNTAIEKTGEELSKGFDVTLKGAPVSELVWIEESNQ